MLWKLTALRLRGAFRAMANRGKKKGSMVLMTFLMVYVVGCMGFLMYMMFDALCRPLCDLGLGWFYFGLAGLMAFALSFVGSIFSTQAQLYEARDNELLLSMPLRPGVILASRMVFLWLMDLFFGAMVLIPAFLAYSVVYDVAVGQRMAWILVCLLLPCLTLAVAALVGWGVAALTSRMARFKTLFTMLLSLGFLGAYLAIYTQIQQILARLIANAQNLADKASAVWPVYHMGLAMETGRGGSLLVTALCTLGPLLIAAFVLEKSFLSIATKKRGAARLQYKGGPQRVSGMEQALLRRERKRLGASAVYMMNSGIGLIMLVLAAAAAVWKRQELLAVLSVFPVGTAPLVCVTAAFICSMTSFTAPSVSLEGKSLWLIRSLPVPTWSVLWAKLRLHFNLTQPLSILSVLVLCWALEVPAAEWIAVLLPVLSLNYLMGVGGLTLNLLFPNLDWVNETAAVKQGMSVLFTILLGMATVLLGGFGFYFLSRTLSDALSLILLGLVYAAAALILHRWLKTKGVRRFEAL